jgi:hypothetical protein
MRTLRWSARNDLHLARWQPRLLGAVDRPTDDSPAARHLTHCSICATWHRRLSMVDRSLRAAYRIPELPAANFDHVVYQRIGPTRG